MKRRHDDIDPRRVLIALALLAAIAAIWIGAAHATEPTCTPAIVTLQSYDRGIVTLDGCLKPVGISVHYDAAGLIVNIVSPDELDGDGIFRNGFEVLQ